MGECERKSITPNWYVRVYYIHESIIIIIHSVLCAVLCTVVYMQRQRYRYAYCGFICWMCRGIFVYTYVRTRTYDRMSDDSGGIHAWVIHVLVYISCDGCVQMAMDTEIAAHNVFRFIFILEIAFHFLILIVIDGHEPRCSYPIQKRPMIFCTEAYGRHEMKVKSECIEWNASLKIIHKNIYTYILKPTSFC